MGYPDTSPSEIHAFRLLACRRNQTDPDISFPIVNSHCITCFCDFPISLQNAHVMRPELSTRLSHSHSFVHKGYVIVSPCYYSALTAFASSSLLFFVIISPLLSTRGMKRHFESGASKRKNIKLATENSTKVVDISNYFIKPTSNSSQKDAVTSCVAVRDDDSSIIIDSDAEPPLPTKTPCEKCPIEKSPVKIVEAEQVTTIQSDSSLLSDDPSQWPETISETQKCDLLRTGPVLIENDYNFPRNSSGRRFSLSYCYRVMDNGEKVRRSWLVYSKLSDRIYCFCCKIFGSVDVPLRRGTSVWEGLGKKLKDHERGRAHLENLEKWFTMRNALRHKATIDNHALEMQHKEVFFYREVLKRLIDVIIFLSERNLAFRGTDEHFGSSSNGNFLGIIEVISKYDNILEKLIEKVIGSRKRSQAHYLSPSSQNEIINAISNSINQKNLSSLRDAKYYSLILDCTPDVSHKEQMSLILRYVKCKPCDSIVIEESFFGFISLDETTGEGLTKSFMCKAKELELDISNMRGQAYDNGANMKGSNRGVQARILEINQRALYFPCAAHSLNLVVNDTAKSSAYALSFFGTINRIYVLFSSSPSRWSILQNNMTVSVKLLSETRWESRISAIRPFRYHFDSLINALNELSQYALEKRDSVTYSETNSILSYIKTWTFLISIFIWHDILSQVNKTSKLIQSATYTTSALTSEIQATIDFLKEFRVVGFQEAKDQASVVANRLNIEQSYPDSRNRLKKRFFDYEGVDQECLSVEDEYRISYFLVLVDAALTSLESRFTFISQWLSIFGFVHERQKLIDTCEQNELERHCHNYFTIMGDIDEGDLAKEILRFKHVLLKDQDLKSAFNFLNYIFEKDLVEIYPNFSIVLRVLLTTPVSVSSAERSFSRLKLIKNFLRSSMSNARLSSLATISIEREVAKQLDYSKIINDLASCKNRRKYFE